MIELLLLAGIALVAVSALRNRNIMRFQAGKKLMLAGFDALAPATGAFPDWLNGVAMSLGVVRATDSWPGAPPPGYV